MSTKYRAAKLRYSYHSEHNADRRDPYLHFVYFATALLLVFIAWIELDGYLKSWETTGDQSYWSIIKIAAFAIAAGLMIYQGVRESQASRGEADRYIRIDDENIVWDLTQVEGEQTVALSSIQRVQRRNIRDLELTLAGGEVKVLPIYLIVSQDKQEDLLKVLWAIVPPNG